VPFPGPSGPVPRTAAPGRVDIAAQKLVWEVVAEPPAVSWHAAGQAAGGTTGYGSLAEVHLVPVPGQRLAMRDLQAVPEQLTVAGRRGGLFGETLGAFVSATDTQATAHINPGRNVDAAGLLVGRNGQRGAWLTLPHDSMGSVLDEDELRPRIAGLLGILLALPVELAERYALGVGLSDVMLLTIGDSNVVGRRKGATMPFASSNDIVLGPEDSAATRALLENVSEVAEEVTARLVAALRRGR